MASIVIYKSSEFILIKNRHFIFFALKAMGKFITLYTAMVTMSTAFCNVK
jgi:hypothetical protein